MSNFNSYARRLDEAANKTFREIQTVNDAFKSAQKAKDSGPRHGVNMDVHMKAKAVCLDADYATAKENLDKLRFNLPSRVDRETKAIRRELEEAVSAAFVADPARVDTAALELLKSGICTAADYEKLLSDADRDCNTTMIRLVASYAGKAAEALKENGSIPFDAKDEWARLDAVRRQGQASTANAVLSSFDALAEIYRRCIGNFGMIPHWQELTSELIENF